MKTHQKKSTTIEKEVTSFIIGFVISKNGGKQACYKYIGTPLLLVYKSSAVPSLNPFISSTLGSYESPRARQIAFSCSTAARA